ncbi:MAG: PH domain-containing protein [Firmicutes bacterium]|nr:PH domain-containing protein [Bacillota bacterium]
MKEYKGFGGNVVTIDGDNVFIKQLLVKENCTFNDIKSVDIIYPTMLKNGSIAITTQKMTYQIIFTKKNPEEFKELFDLINEKVSSESSVIDDPMKTAEGLYQYCLDNNFGQGLNREWGIKHFNIISQNLMNDEEVKVAFIGLQNFISMTKHNGNYAYAITNKRILSAQKKIIGESFQTISLDNINDITLNTGMLMGIITVDTIKETFNIAVNKQVAQNIFTKVHEVLDAIKNPQVNNKEVNSNISIADELKKFKDLLDSGILTQEEFDAQKTKLLNS